MDRTPSSQPIAAAGDILPPAVSPAWAAAPILAPTASGQAALAAAQALAK